MTKKGLYKLATKPHVFVRDYIGKNKDKKEKLKVYVEKLIDINIPYHRYYYMLFSIFNKLGFEHVAEKALLKAISLKSKAIYHYKLGVLLKRKSQWWQIVETLSKALELNPTADMEWHLAYAEALEKMNRFEEASVVLEKFAKNETLDSDGYFTYGDLLKKISKKDASLSAFSKAIKLDTSKDSKELGIGIFYEKKGRWIEALEAYKEEVERQPENALIYYKLGLSYDRCYEWEDAEESFVKAISIDTTNAHWFYRLGFVRERQAKWKEAEEAYRFALERQNNFYPSWYYRLGFVLEKQEKYKEATVAFKEQRVLQDAHGITETTYNKNKSLKRIVNYTEYYKNLEIDNKCIIYESYQGSSLSCSPYAIFKLLLEDTRFNEYKHVWIISDKNRIPKELKKYQNIIFISKNSDRYMRYLASAKYLINNTSFPDWYIRKEEQIYLNTWHGTPIKTLGRDVKEDFMAHKNQTRNFLQASHLISPNKYTTNIMLNSYDIKDTFSGVFATTGYPRQDLMLNIKEEKKLEIEKKLNLLSEKKTVLYAPTWRGTVGKAVFDVDKLINDIKKIQELENVQIIFRGHYMVEEILSNLKINVTVVPSEIDTNSLLSIVDILITDYSSICFDFMALGKPILYYVYDRKEYEEERGLYFTLEELGGEICYNIDELKIALNEVLINQKITTIQKKAQDKFCSYDDGKSTERVIDLLFFNKVGNCDIYQKSLKESILLYGGPLMANGITTSFINLVNFINQDKYIVTIVIDPNVIENNELRMEQFNKFNRNIKVVPRVGKILGTLEERWILGQFNINMNLFDEKQWSLYEDLHKREFKRIFGYGHYDHIINFEGYTTFWTTLMGMRLNFRQTNTIYQHNDLFGEWTMKYPYLEKTFNLYRYYEKIISVSEKTMEHNMNNLSELFNIDKEKFQFVDNVQNSDNILQMFKEMIDKEDEFIFENKKVFLNIGRLSPEKGHMKLIKAFKAVVSKYSDIHLINLGMGVQESEIKNLIKELGLKDKVFYLGQKSNPYAYLKKSDCFVLASDHEGQPMTLFEAMILNKPIIATDIVGNRSVLLSDRPGLLVKNSEEGLMQGMLDFLEGRYVEKKTFDYQAYNQNALNMFYNKVLGEFK